MHIIYVDEYGETLFSCSSDIAPVANDTVIIRSEDWYVRSRSFDTFNNVIMIELTQTATKPRVTESADNSGRLNSLQNSIMQISKQQGDQEKKTRALRDEIVTVRKFIKTQSKPSKGPQDDSR